MEIVFTLLDEDGLEYPEAAASSFALRGALPCAPGDFDGNLHFVQAGQEEAVLSDDLQVLIRTVLEAFASAKAEGAAIVSLSSVYRQFRLTVSGETVRLEEATEPPAGDFSPREYPAADFASALRACAGRFERFLSTLTERDPQWMDDLARLRDALTKIGA